MEIFESLIVDIERLVEEQVNLVKIKRMSESSSGATLVKVRSIAEPRTKALEITTRQAIFLVGEFGASEYLKARLEAQHADIKVIQPHGAWAAVVK